MYVFFSLNVYNDKIDVKACMYFFHLFLCVYKVTITWIYWKLLNLLFYLELEMYDFFVNIFQSGRGFKRNFICTTVWYQYSNVSSVARFSEPLAIRSLSKLGIRSPCTWIYKSADFIETLSFSTIAQRVFVQN